MTPRPFTCGLAACFAALLACALIPVAAEAASVSESPTTLTYTADLGETNNLSILPANGAYVVKDTGAASLVDGDGVGGCTVIGNTAGPGGDAISGGNGADQLIGGPGNDQFDSGAAEGADDIRGGLDTATSATPGAPQG